MWEYNVGWFKVNILQSLLISMSVACLFVGVAVRNTFLEWHKTNLSVVMTRLLAGFNLFHKKLILFFVWLILIPILAHF